MCFQPWKICETYSAYIALAKRNHNCIHSSSKRCACCVPFLSGPFAPIQPPAGKRITSQNGLYACSIMPKPKHIECRRWVESALPLPSQKYCYPAPVLLPPGTASPKWRMLPVYSFLAARINNAPPSREHKIRYITEPPGRNEYKHK